MSGDFKITRTLSLLSDCWALAEKALQHKIANFQPAISEVHITQQFHGQFAEALFDASSKRKFENAFRADIRASAASVTFSDDAFHRIASGLVANVTLHNQQTETVTGGDLGLTIARPKLRFHIGGVQRKQMRSGLLCQAKLRSSDAKWRSLTINQKKVLPPHTEYLALLLYEYKDSERYQLNDFVWQLCKGETVKQIDAWLRNGAFPSSTTARELLQELGEGRIGTTNPKIIAEFLIPEQTPRLEIVIDWPGNPDGASSFIRVDSAQQQRDHVRVYA